MLTTDLEAVEKALYQRIEEAYAKYPSTMESFRDEAMPKEQYFLTAIAASSSAEDPNLPSAREEAAEEQKTEAKRWKVKYEDWLNATLSNLEVVDSTEEGAVMDLQLLAKNQSSALDAPVYAEDFWKAVGDKALTDIQGIGGEVSYLQAKELVEEALLAVYNTTVKEDFLQLALESGEAEMPRGLKGWLKTSTNHREGLQGVFEQEYIAWTKEISKVVAVCENQNKGKTFTVDLKKLEHELVERFAYTVNGVQPGEQLLKSLQQALPQKATTDFTTLLTHWKDGVTALQDRGLVELLWEEYLTKEAGQQPMQQAVDNFISKLPSSESLINALLDARYIAPKKERPSSPSTGQVLDLLFKSTRTSNCYYSAKLPIPLKLVPFLDEHTGLEMFHAVPKVEGIAFNHLHCLDAKSSKVDSLKEIRTTIAKQAQYYQEASNLISKVILRLGVTDTTEERVVVNAKNGGLDVVSLSMDARNSIKGLSGYNGQTLGTNLKIKGDKKGNVKELIGSIDILGFSFKIHAGKEGIYGTVKSPLAFQEAVTMQTYGSFSYDLTLTFTIESVIGQRHQVNVIGLEHDDRKAGGELVLAASKLKVELTPSEIFID